MIEVLPEAVQNKIAAGEVIERPASVVKELVENSLDAGAGKIVVEMEEGGHRLIRVSDDGSGMDEADLVACVQRHATSKIRDAGDIFGVRTMGFRGEALPSIAAVSRMSIHSGAGADAEARQLVIEGGARVRLSPAPPRRGTSVEVRDIFFNTPARRKFLKQASSENSRAAEFMTRLALGNPGVDMLLQLNGRLNLAAHPRKSLADRVADLFGAELAERLRPLDRKTGEGVEVSGLVAPPPESRGTSGGIYILMNRRWIRHAGMARAVTDAFQGSLPPRKYPFAVIVLEIDPGRVDVNVHPTKEEVRFDNERLVVSSVRRAVDDALRAGSRAVSPENPGFPEKGRPLFSGPISVRDGSPGSGGTGNRPAGRTAPLFGNAPRTPGFAALDFKSARERVRAADAPLSRPEPPRPPTPEDGPKTLHNYRILGQAGGKYLLAEGPSGLLLVDPHALHERWNYDRLLARKEKGVIARRLLLPVGLRLAPAELALLDEAIPALEEMGFSLSLEPPDRLSVAAAPDFIPPEKLEHLLRQIFSDLEGAGPAVEAFRGRLLASLACRSAVLLGTSLPEDEMLLLLDRFFQSGQMPTCPHGRPTAITIAWDELARRFER